MNKLSLVIIAFNEEEHIARCIVSALPVADEIIVVDSGSTDRTRQIAFEHGARVIYRAFTNYTDQKNYAMNQAAHPWVLNLDGDEALDNTLQAAIQQQRRQGFNADAYSMNRLNFFNGRPIKTCGWYPDTKIRLWNRSKGGWTGQLVHEQLTMQPGSNISHLGGNILHYSFANREAMAAQAEKFAGLAAQQLKHKARAYLLLKMVFSPLFKWIKNYLFNLGFTDGATGLVICNQQSREVFLKYYRALKMK